ncbi:hypothetical protein CAPTEDRAFT_225327 [Capitella teleta]|uniref:Uncharacterized protein n=1 Tax=Capitella teleta TaxID=283909 RepID=R7TXS3_CAPTE|nr:hypothetical protein CAPTEDRAFT_225327 [Capitella teleta]|eukprot:ELT98534.1 hypothetical protein CAPTEDRAFT_225327 [Capitella teleta]
MQPSMSHASVDPAEFERQRYMHQMHRRSMPPRCNPIGIIFMVLCLGMVFIGLTMTVIAHWPGNSSIGENPLKIAGPCLLAIGGVAFIAGMVRICTWQEAKKVEWQSTMQQIAQSRSAMHNQMIREQYQEEEDDQSQMYLSHGQSMDIKPGPGILKTPSISTYGKGSEYGEDYNNYQYGDQGGGGGYNQEGVGYKPNPQQPAYNTGVSVEPSATDYEGQVPVPVRQITKKKPRPSPDRIPDKEVLVQEEQRQMQSYPSQEGFDMFQGGEQKPTTKPRSKKKKQPEATRDSSHSNVGYEHDHHAPAGYYGNSPQTPASQYSYSDQGASPLAGAGGLGLAGAGGGLAGMGGMGVSPGMEQQLKINIRAQPNTAVHITPGTYHTTPTQPHKPYNQRLNMSQASVASAETEI